MTARTFAAAVLMLLLHPGGAAAENLHLIDAAPNGFAIYRSGAPSAADFAQWCRLGISEVMVLSGDANEVEGRMTEQCPGLKIFYNERQNARIPVDVEFLKLFDTWVQEAQAAGKKILFRCSCGCHRTGRLAAYYEMKYLKRTSDQAVENMLAKGRRMFLYPYLRPQVFAMDDFIGNRSCRYTSTDEAPAYCVGGN